MPERRTRFSLSVSPVFLPILRVALCAVACLGAILARTASAAEIQDFVRIRGLEGDKLVGIGLVVGLDGTGDSMKDSTIAGQPYAQLLKTLGNISSTRQDQLKTKSVAIVFVTVEIPYGGARIGDKIDARVSVLGNAKSLKGGTLVSTHLVTEVVPADRSQWVPYALADGSPIEVGEITTGGVIRGGARMVRDVIKSPFEGNTVALVLNAQYVGYPAASAIASAINEELELSGFSEAARVEDSQTVRVRIPDPDLEHRSEFLGKLLTFAVPTDVLRLEARVIIDMRAKVMTIDENVEFRPTAVTADALHITSITPAMQPTPENPVLETVAWTGLATGEQNRSSMKLRDLIASLNQLAVPFETQVAIVEALDRQGALKGKVVRK